MLGWSTSCNWWSLEPAKSFCYLLDFSWDGSKWTYIPDDDLPGKFTLTDPSGNRHPLRRFPPSHAVKTLGVYISMDGNEQAEINFLKQECIDFGARMRSASCTKNEALYSFNTSLLPKLEYAMPVTDISESQWIIFWLLL